jgi:hypothetical protein
MSEEDGERIHLGPRPEAVRLERTIRLDREGVHRTQFFFSYSGGLIVEGKLSRIAGEVGGSMLEISAPLRLGPPSLRPTPQLTFENVGHFFQVDIPTPFPLQASTFPGPTLGGEARANCWFGPSTFLSPDAPALPADTFLVTYWGADSPGHGENIERFILRPLLEWLRVLTHQWWIGRSIEGASGPLHFLAPLSEDNRFAGSPTPVARGTSAGPLMVPLTEAIWTEAARRALTGEVPPAERALEADANYMLASREFRSGIILACSAIEAARDSALLDADLRLSQLKTSTTDLLKHLSVGFGHVFGADLARDAPELFGILSAFWRARGEAAHGKPVRWRMDPSDKPIEDVEFGTLSDNLRRILAWIAAIPND